MEYFLSVFCVVNLAPTRIGESQRIDYYLPTYSKIIEPKKT